MYRALRATLLLACVALFAAPTLSLAMSSDADKMCTPWHKDCECGMEPNPAAKYNPRVPKCIKGKNTNKCPVGICFDVTNGEITTKGICAESGKCQAMQCLGTEGFGACQKTDQKVDTSKNTPGAPAVPPAGGTGGLPQIPTPGGGQAQPEVPSKGDSLLSRLLNPTPLSEDKSLFAPSAQGFADQIQTTANQPGVLDKIEGSITNLFSPTPLGETGGLQPGANPDGVQPNTVQTVPGENVNTTNTFGTAPLSSELQPAQQKGWWDTITDKFSSAATAVKEFFTGEPAPAAPAPTEGEGSLATSPGATRSIASPEGPAPAEPPAAPAQGPTVPQSTAPNAGPFQGPSAETLAEDVQRTGDNFAASRDKYESLLKEAGATIGPDGKYVVPPPSTAEQFNANSQLADVRKQYDADLAEYKDALEKYNTMPATSRAFAVAENAKNIAQEQAFYTEQNAIGDTNAAKLNQSINYLETLQSCLQMCSNADNVANAFLANPQTLSPEANAARSALLGQVGDWGSAQSALTAATDQQAQVDSRISQLRDVIDNPDSTQREIRAAQQQVALLEASRGTLDAEVRRQNTIIENTNTNIEQLSRVVQGGDTSELSPKVAQIVETAKSDSKGFTLENVLTGGYVGRYVGDALTNYSHWISETTGIPTILNPLAGFGIPEVAVNSFLNVGGNPTLSTQMAELSMPNEDIIARRINDGIVLATVVDPFTGGQLTGSLARGVEFARTAETAGTSMFSESIASNALKSTGFNPSFASELDNFGSRVAAPYLEQQRGYYADYVSRGMSPAEAETTSYQQLYRNLAESNLSNTTRAEEVLAPLRNEMSSRGISIPEVNVSRSAAVADTLEPVVNRPPVAYEAPATRVEPVAPAPAAPVAPVESAPLPASTNLPVPYTQTATVQAGSVAELGPALRAGVEAGVVPRIGVAEIDGARYMYELAPNGNPVLSPMSAEAAVPTTRITTGEMSYLADLRGVAPTFGDSSMPLVMRTAESPVTAAERTAIQDYTTALTRFNSWENPVVSARTAMSEAGLGETLAGDIYRVESGEVLGNIIRPESPDVFAARADAAVPEYIKAGNTWYDKSLREITNPDTIAALEGKVEAQTVAPGQVAADVARANEIAELRAESLASAEARRAAAERAAQSVSDAQAQINPARPVVEPAAPAPKPAVPESADVKAGIANLQKQADIYALQQNGPILSGSVPSNIREALSTMKNAGGIPEDMKFATSYLDGSVYRIDAAGDITRISNADVIAAVREAPNTVMSTSEAISAARSAQRTLDDLAAANERASALAAAQNYEGEILVTRNIAEARLALDGNVPGLAQAQAASKDVFAWSPSAIVNPVDTVAAPSLASGAVSAETKAFANALKELGGEAELPAASAPVRFAEAPIAQPQALAAAEPVPAPAPAPAPAPVVEKPFLTKVTDAIDEFFSVGGAKAAPGPTAPLPAVATAPVDIAPVIANVEKGVVPVAAAAPDLATYANAPPAPTQLSKIDSTLADAVAKDKGQVPTVSEFLRDVQPSQRGAFLPQTIPAIIQNGGAATVGPLVESIPYAPAPQLQNVADLLNKAGYSINADQLIARANSNIDNIFADTFKLVDSVSGTSRPIVVFYVNPSPSLSSIPSPAEIGAELTNGVVAARGSFNATLDSVGTAHLYALRVSADEARILKLDTPIKKQSVDMQKALADLADKLGITVPEGALGSDVYDAVKAAAGDDAKAAKQLSLSGITAASKTVGATGVTDYTVFDPAALEAIGRDGLALAPQESTFANTEPVGRAAPIAMEDVWAQVQRLIDSGTSPNAIRVPAQGTALPAAPISSKVANVVRASALGLALSTAYVPATVPYLGDSIFSYPQAAAATYYAPGTDLGKTVASCYGSGCGSPGFDGRLTANGERFNPGEYTAANKTLPFGTRVKVTNLSNGKSVVVRINDRGPYVGGRGLDLSPAAAQAIGSKGGLANVRLEVVDKAIALGPTSGTPPIASAPAPVSKPNTATTFDAAPTVKSAANAVVAEESYAPVVPVYLKSISDEISKLTQGKVKIASLHRPSNDSISKLVIEKLNTKFSGMVDLSEPGEVEMFELLKAELAKYPSEYWSKSKTLYLYTSTLKNLGKLDGFSVYDVLWIRGRAKLDSTIHHELAHANGELFPSAVEWSKNVYASSADTVYTEGKAVFDASKYVRIEGFASTYAGTAAGEDIAETVGLLFENPQKFAAAAQYDPVLAKKIAVVKESLAAASGGVMNDAYWASLKPINPNYIFEPVKGGNFALTVFTKKQFLNTLAVRSTDLIVTAPAPASSNLALAPAPAPAVVAQVSPSPAPAVVAPAAEPPASVAKPDVKALEAELASTQQQITDTNAQISKAVAQQQTLKPQIAKLQNIDAGKSNLATAEKGLNLMKSLWSAPDANQKRILVAGTSAAARLATIVKQLGNAGLAAQINTYVGSLNALSKPENQTLGNVNKASSQGDKLVADARTYLANLASGEKGNLATLKADDKKLETQLAGLKKSLASLRAQETKLAADLKAQSVQVASVPEPVVPEVVEPPKVQEETTEVVVEPEATPPAPAVAANTGQMQGEWAPVVPPENVVVLGTSRGIPTIEATEPATAPAEPPVVQYASAAPVVPNANQLSYTFAYGLNVPSVPASLLAAKINVATKPREPRIEEGSGGAVPEKNPTPLPPAPKPEEVAATRAAYLADPVVQTDAFKNFPRAPLTGDEAAVQEAAIAKYVKDKNAVIESYQDHFGNKIVNPDLARLLFRNVGYDGLNAGAVQKVVSDISDTLWKMHLESNVEPTAVIYTGSAGAGKSTTVGIVLPKLSTEAAVILDGTLTNPALAKQRIEEALAAGKAVEVVHVYRDPIEAWNDGVIPRMLGTSIDAGRVVPISVFTVGYKRSLEITRSLLDDPRVKVDLIKNETTEGVNGSFASPSVMTKDEFLGIKYSSSIERTIRHDTKALLDAGKITPAQYEALTGVALPKAPATVAAEPVAPTVEPSVAVVDVDVPATPPAAVAAEVVMPKLASALEDAVAELNAADRFYKLAAEIRDMQTAQTLAETAPAQTIEPLPADRSLVAQPQQRGNISTSQTPDTIYVNGRGEASGNISGVQPVAPLPADRALVPVSPTRGQTSQTPTPGTVYVDSAGNASPNLGDVVAPEPPATFQPEPPLQAKPVVNPNPALIYGLNNLLNKAGGYVSSAYGRVQQEIAFVRSVFAPSPTKIGSVVDTNSLAQDLNEAVQDINRSNRTITLAEEPQMETPKVPATVPAWYSGWVDAMRSAEGTIMDTLGVGKGESPAVVSSAVPVQPNTIAKAPATSEQPALPAPASEAAPVAADNTSPVPAETEAPAPAASGESASVPANMGAGENVPATQGPTNPRRAGDIVPVPQTGGGGGGSATPPGGGSGAGATDDEGSSLPGKAWGAAKYLCLGGWKRFVICGAVAGYGISQLGGDSSAPNAPAAPAAPAPAKPVVAPGTKCPDGSIAGSSGCPKTPPAAPPAAPPKAPTKRICGANETPASSGCEMPSGPGGVVPGPANQQDGCLVSTTPIVWKPNCSGGANSGLGSLGSALGQMLGKALGGSQPTQPATGQATPTTPNTGTSTRPALTAVIIVNPTLVASGSTATLSWSSAAVDSCEVYDSLGRGYASSTSGSTSTLPIATTTVFRIGCLASGTSVSGYATSSVR